MPSMNYIPPLWDEEGCAIAVRGPAYDWTGRAFPAEFADTCGMDDCEVYNASEYRYQPRVYDRRTETHGHLCCECGCYCEYNGHDEERHADWAADYCDPDSYDDRSRGIFNYSYKPEPVFHGSGAYHLGVELEITASSRASAQPIYDYARSQNADSLFYCKEDGSVNGFEIVSHPMSPGFFRDFNWRGFFRLLNEEYPIGTNARGQRILTEREGHGLHVHVSRSAFPNVSSLARWSYLLNKNATEVQKIARRRGSRWAEVSRTSVLDAVSGAFRADQARWRTAMDHADRYNPESSRATRYFGVMGARKPLRHHYPERYLMCNHQNTGTVEVRVFRSTRKAEQFRESVGLVIDTVEFVRDMHSRHEAISSLTWEAFQAHKSAKTPNRISVA